MTRSPEDALRDVLHGASDDPVGGGSFADVRARARRIDRRSRLLKAGGAAVVLLAIVGVSIPLLDDGDDKARRVITEPGPDKVTTTPEPSDEPVGIWPFATAAEADDNEIELPFNPTDPVETAAAFLTAVLDIEETDCSKSVAGDGAGGVAVICLGTIPRRQTTVELRKLGTSDRFTVMEARADGLLIDSPESNNEVVWPLTVEGRATAFEGTVLVKVISRDLEPKNLGETFMTGEMGELKPFSGEIGFEPDASGLGAVIAWTDSAEDGSVEQVAAMPIRWEPPSGQSTSSLPAGEPLDDYHVVAVLTETIEGDPDVQDVVVLDQDGTILNQYIDDFGTAEGGVLDIHVSADRRTVLVALATSACTSEIRVFAADRSDVRNLGAGDHVALSPDNRQLAVSVDPECDGTDVIEIRDLVGKAATRRIAVEGGRVGSLTWVDATQLVYDVHDNDQNVTVHVRSGERSDRVLEPPQGRSWSMSGGGASGNVRLLLSNGDVVRVDVSTGEIVATIAELGSTSGVVDLAETFYLLWLTTDSALHAAVPREPDRVLRTDVAMIADMPRIAG